MDRLPFYENPVHCSTAFKPETGALLLFRPGQVQLYKGGWKPIAMTKTAETNRWVFNRGGDLLNIRNTIDQVRRYRSEQRKAEEDGEAQKRPLRYHLECLDRFLETVPPEVMTELRRFRRRSWPMYSFLARSGTPAIELAGTNRACAFCVGNAWVFAPRRVQWEMRRSRALVRRRRRDILGRLGFPSSNTAVRVLSRIVDDTIDIAPLLFLRQAMADEATLRRLAHVPRVNAGVIRLVSDGALLPLTSQRLLLEVGHVRAFDVSGGDLNRLVRDTLMMTGDDDRCLPVLRSMAHLCRIHDELAEDYRRRGPVKNVRFGEPPLPGVDEVLEPLRDARALHRESVEMKNCLAAPHYTRAVLAGRLYIYRLLHPQRCSVAVEPDFTNGGYRLREVRAVCNQRPALSALDLLGRWLAANNPQLLLFDDQPVAAEHMLGVGFHDGDIPF